MPEAQEVQLTCGPKVLLLYSYGHTSTFVSTKTPDAPVRTHLHPEHGFSTCFSTRGHADETSGRRAGPRGDDAHPYNGSLPARPRGKPPAPGVSGEACSGV